MLSAKSQSDKRLPRFACADVCQIVLFPTHKTHWYVYFEQGELMSHLVHHSVTSILLREYLSKHSIFLILRSGTVSILLGGRLGR